MARRAALFALLCACGGARPPASVTTPPPLEVAPIAPPGRKTAAPEDVGPLMLGERALTQWTKPDPSCPTIHVNHPTGGIRWMWCHRPLDVTLESIAKAAGLDIFTSGPHTRSDLELGEENAFGHYNLAFVEWLAKHAVSAPDSPARRATQRLYDKNAEPLVEILGYALGKIQHEPQCFATEKRLYADLIMQKRLPAHYFERWYHFMNPFFCDRATKPHKDYFDDGDDGGIDGDVVATATGFWIRRALDGTFEAFAKGLENVIASYGPAFLERPLRLPDGAAMLKAVDEGVRRVADCKSVGRKRMPSVHLGINFQPDGTVRLDGDATTDPRHECIALAFSSVQLPPHDGLTIRFFRSVHMKY